MSLLVKMTLSAALVLSIGVPFGAFAAGEKTKGRYKTALGVNVFLFFGTMIAAAAFMFSGNAFAAEETAAAASNSAAGMGYLSAALATGLSIPHTNRFPPITTAQLGLPASAPASIKTTCIMAAWLTAKAPTRTKERVLEK